MSIISSETARSGASGTVSSPVVPWSPGQLGAGYIATKRTASGGCMARLVTWSKDSGVRAAERMQADRVPIKDAAVEWALVRISPEGTAVLSDPRDLSDNTTARLTTLARIAQALDPRLTCRVRPPVASADIRRGA